MTQPAPIAVALDAPDLETAARWAGLVTPHVSTVKVGLELYLRYGPEVVASIRGASGVKIFLDLKLHDIPATVTGAARAVARLRPDLLTVHAAGGSDVVRAAVEGAPDTIVAAVTVLTSLNSADLEQIGVMGPMSDAVRRLAVLGGRAGARGLVGHGAEPAAVAQARSRHQAEVRLRVSGRPLPCFPAKIKRQAVVPGAFDFVCKDSVRVGVVVQKLSMPSCRDVRIERRQDAIARDYHR